MQTINTGFGCLCCHCFIQECKPSMMMLSHCFPLTIFAAVLSGLTACWIPMGTLISRTPWMWLVMWRSCSAGLWPTSGTASSPKPDTRTCGTPRGHLHLETLTPAKPPGLQPGQVGQICVTFCYSGFSLAVSRMRIHLVSNPCLLAQDFLKK